MFFLSITGCETCKGFKKDWNTFFEKMRKADNWFQEEYW